MAQATAIVEDKGIRPGYNETGTTIAAQIIVKKVAGSVGDPNSVAVAGDGDSHFGVTMQEIKNLERGDVQTTGQALVKSGAVVAAGVEFTADGSGKAIAAVSGDYIGGVTVTAAGGADEEIAVELAGPSSGRIKA